MMILGLFILITGHLYAQKIDESRMERDLEIAENILATLMKSDGAGRTAFYGVSRFNGSYVKGYGVIFGDAGSGSNVFFDRGPARIVIDRSHGLAQGLPGGKGVVTVGRDGKIEDLDSLQEDKNKRWFEKVETFLLDYADLVGQLKPSDKIMITKGHLGAGNDWAHITAVGIGPVETGRGTSLEISKQDLIDLRQGKISREEAAKRIKIIDNTAHGKTEQDIALLASIFERLYQSDLSETYHVTGKVYHHRVQEFGVIYTMRVYSSLVDDIGFYHRDSRGRSRRSLDPEEHSAKVQELYPIFIATLKENIARYGTTLTSLGQEEVALFKIRISGCEACDIPTSLELSVKASDLKAHKAGKLSEPAVIEKITTKEIR